jgi:hypothetical protein
MIKTSLLSLVILITSTFFFSCSLTREAEFTKRKYFDFPRDHQEAHKESQESLTPSGNGPLLAQAGIRQKNNIAEVKDTVQQEKQNYFFASFKQKSPLTTNTTDRFPIRTRELLKNVFTPTLKHSGSAAELKHTSHTTSPLSGKLYIERIYFYLIIAMAIIAPPLGIFLFDWFANSNTFFQKKFSPPFWISLVLVLLAVGAVPFKTTSLLNIYEWVFYGLAAIVAILHLFHVLW